MRAVQKRVQGRKHALDTLGPGNPAVIDADPDGRQPKTHRGNAARRSRRGPVRHQAVPRVCQVPKIIEVRLLHIFQEFVIVRERTGSRRDGDGEGDSSCELVVQAVIRE